jgi:hypothetical protein
MCPDRIGILVFEALPDGITRSVVVMTGKVPRDSQPVEEFIGQRSARAALQRLCQKAIGNLVFSFLQAGVRLTQIQHIEQILGRQRVDRAVVDDLALVGNVERGQPNQIELSYPWIKVVEPEPDESRVHDGTNGGIWIRHGIQQLTADSVVLLDVDEDDFVLGPRTLERVIPVV